MGKIVERILQVIESQGDSQREFYAKTGISNGFLNKVKSIGSDKLLLILSAYPNVSLDWLVTGQGEMFKKQAALGNEMVVFDPEAPYTHMPNTRQEQINQLFANEIYNLQKKAPGENFLQLKKAFKNLDLKIEE